jgi:hypothetical protein
MNVTLGMATYDDYNGVYFTIMSALHMHRDYVRDFVVIDNNPNSPDGKAVRDFCGKIGAVYVATRANVGTSSRNKVFQHAKDGLVICVDSHVQIETGGVAAIVEAAEQMPDRPILFTGPLLYEGYLLGQLQDGHPYVATHWNDEWGAGMHGRWDYDARYEEGKPFPIPMQGCGMFACLRQHWLGFSPFFAGFGGEEGYIHEKYRRAGGDAICVPKAGWSHRFGQVGPPKYRVSLDQFCLNYIIGRLENELPYDDVIEQYQKILPPGRVDEIVKEAYKLVRRTIISP